MRIRQKQSTNYLQQSRQIETAAPPFTFSRFSMSSEKRPEKNEDSIVVEQRHGLVAVFDGVGGSTSGGEAAQIGARTVRRAWRRLLLEHQIIGLADTTHFDLPIALCQLVEEAQQQIEAEGIRRVTNADPQDVDFPGTTIVLAVVCRQYNSSGYILGYAHVGDSRLYLLRNDETLIRLTADDGYLGTLLHDQTISEKDALRIDQATHADQLTETELSYFEKRNGITQSLSHSTKGRILDIHINQTIITPGDRILLCSDGVHDNLTDAEIARILRNGARTTVAKRLVQQSIQHSHLDNQLHIRAKSDDMSAVVITVIA